LSTTDTTTLEGKSGLTDTQRSVLTVIVLALIGLPAMLQTLPEEQQPPSYVMPMLLIGAFIAGIVREQFGIRSVAVAVKSKAVDSRIKIDKKFGDLGKNNVAAQPVV